MPPVDTGAATAAMVLRAALVAVGRPGGPVGTLPSAAGAWPCYVDHMPAGGAAAALCVYDTQGNLDGRLMGTGHVIRHPGWQIRCRAADYPTGAARAKLVQARLEAIVREQVVIGGETYTIASVTQTSDILPLGQEPEGKRRNLFTLNGTITFRKT